MNDMTDRLRRDIENVASIYPTAFSLYDEPLDRLTARIAKTVADELDRLNEEARRFYHADGTYVLCATAAQCVDRRIHAAGILDRLLDMGRLVQVKPPDYMKNSARLRGWQTAGTWRAFVAALDAAAEARTG